jgi:hypothetical protein
MPNRNPYSYVCQRIFFLQRALGSAKGAQFAASAGTIDEESLINPQRGVTGLTLTV